ncbi:hypothetical protein IFR05_016558, partial [Cadophora sp. M221]
FLQDTNKYSVTQYQMMKSSIASYKVNGAKNGYSSSASRLSSDFGSCGKDRADNVLGTGGVFIFPLCTAAEAHNNWGKVDWTNNPNHPCNS